MLENLTKVDRLALVTKYPFMIFDNGLPHDDCCWADIVPHGWWVAFGEQMCADFADAIEADGIKEEFIIIEIKEKYGMLEIYHGGWGKHTRDVCEKYASISRQTCINCGKPSTIRKKNGWVMPLCDDCYEEAWK